MASQVLVSLAPIGSTPAPMDNVVKRRSANYHPSVWGDRFLSLSPDHFVEANDKSEHEKLKQQVKTKLQQSFKDPVQKLEFIDSIQRLGVSYHFENEIDKLLRDVYLSNSDNNENVDDGLYALSLTFRLLRQQGYKLSCDVFNKFKDSVTGNFKACLIADPRGMLSLYEAAHLSIRGENILDEALAFTTAHLKSLATNSNSTKMASKITHALNQPIRRGLPRIEASHYFSVYEEDPSHDKVLLKFAKLDFNILQKLHQKELADISKWWRELDLSNKLPFARDRLVECYFWIMGVYYEPEYSVSRKFMTKVIKLTSVIDDIYDVYGTPEELGRFSDAIERWDISAMPQLPEYMRVCYKALLDVYEEIEESMVNAGKGNCFAHVKDAMKKQVRMYLLESKWLEQNYVPRMDEYMSIAVPTSGYQMLSKTCAVGMGNISNKDCFEWVSNEHKLVTASAIICRISSDITSHKFEQKRGHVASSLECYMKQYGVSEEEAIVELRTQVAGAWKDINEVFLHPTAALPLLTRVLNLARVIDVVYKNEDGYTNSKGAVKDFISSLLVGPVPV